MENREGKRLDEYRLLRLLGRGAFGEVYLGEHIRHQTPVAIKLLNIRTTPNTDTTAYFIREARNMFRLKHSNIVQLLDFGIEESIPFLVMEYAPNGTLRQRHPPGSLVSFPQIRSYVRQLASALQYAHDARLIHRDVKPQNMLLGERDQVLLGDFGVAAIAHSELSLDTQDLAGSMSYIAPEQIRGKPRPASDQYALGICVYEWLCGALPFQGKGWDLITQHQETPPPPLRPRVPTIPEAVERVVLKALEKDPEQRFADMRTFAAALEEAMQTTEHAPVVSPHRMSAPSQPMAPGTTLAGQPQDQQISATSPAARRSRRPLFLLTAPVLLICAGILLYFTFSGALASLLNPEASAASAARMYASVTAANGVMFGFDAAHTHWNPYEKVITPASVSRLALLWTYPTGNIIGSSPVVANGMIYVGSADHRLYAFSASCKQNCRPLWSYATGEVIDSSPAVAHGILYVGSADHKFYAFSASCKQNCRPLWSYTTGDVIDASPVIAHGMVYVGSADHKFYAFSASCTRSCQPLWSYTTGDVIASSPAVSGNMVYAGSADGRLYAFSASCKQNCQPLWSYPVGDSTFSSPAVANHSVYVGSVDGRLYAFSASCVKDCRPLWSYSVGAAIITSPAVANGIVYAGSADGRLYAFPASCEQQCRPGAVYIVGESAFSSPTIAGGLVFVGGSSHTLYAFNAACTGQCRPLWSFGAAPAIAPSANIVSTFMNSSPAVANGMIYVGSGDYKLYAFGFK